MNFKIVIDQRAIDEIAEAAKWYSKKSLIASENFEKKLPNPSIIYNLQ